MRVLNFNSQATVALVECGGSKLRMEMRDGTLFIRPTDRKAGPHVLSELQNGQDDLSVEITDKAFEKLASTALVDGATFGLEVDRYGWFALREVTNLGEKAVEGALVTVEQTT